MNNASIQSDQNPDYFGASATPMVMGYDLTRYQYFLASPFFAGFDSFQDTKRKLFLEEFRQMSENVKSFLTSIETAKTIFSTSQENNLEENQIYQTAELFRDVITGKVFIKDLPNVLAQKVSIDAGVASQIVNKVISQSFGPIIEDLKRIQRSKFPDRISQIQKEAQPGSLSRPGVRPAPTPPPTSAQSLQQAAPQTEAITGNQANQITRPTSVRPPIPEIRQAPIQSPPQMPARPPVQPPQPPPLKTSPLAPPVNLAPPITPPKAMPGSGGGLPDQDAQKSLEAELEKVANVIDLRNTEK